MNCSFPNSLNQKRVIKIGSEVVSPIRLIDISLFSTVLDEENEPCKVHSGPLILLTFEDNTTELSQEYLGTRPPHR